MPRAKFSSLNNQLQYPENVKSIKPSTATSEPAEARDEVAVNSLDVGSYSNKRAAIGVDLRVQKQLVDVRASVEYLPFRSKVFESSISSHVIEHVQKPRQMITEMQRVTLGTVTLEFPKPRVRRRPEGKCLRVSPPTPF